MRVGNKKRSQGWMTRSIDLSLRLMEGVEDEQIRLGYVSFEMPFRHPNGDFVVGSVCLEFRGWF